MKTNNINRLVLLFIVFIIGLTSSAIAQSSYNKFVVVLDAGHGGKDPGAIGQLGTREKDITLKTSILLAKKLRNIGTITPILSRNKDIYLPLRQRTKLAKKNNADIFLEQEN